MKTELPYPKKPANITPGEEYRRFLLRQERAQLVADVVSGLIYGGIAVALIVCVWVLCDAKAKQNAAELAADSAHADRVVFEGGVK